MKETFVKLQKLQGIIARKYELEDKIRDVPKDLADAERLLKKISEDYIEYCHREEKLKAEIEELEAQKQETERRREELEASVETIILSKDYESVQKDIDNAKNQEQQTRNYLLEKTKQLENLSKKIMEQEESRNAQKADVDEEREKVDKITAGLEADLAAVDAQIHEFSEGIPESMLFKFERIIRNKDNVGIVPVHDNVCEGCHMTLPLQFVNEVREGNDIMFCPYCSRVLYYEETEQPEAAQAFSDFVSADEFDGFDKEDADKGLEEDF